MGKGAGLNNVSHVKISCKCKSCVLGGLNDISFFRSGSPQLCVRYFCISYFNSGLYVKNLIL